MSPARSADRLTLLACLFVAGAMLLGGGGSPHPLAELLLQLLAVATAACWLSLRQQSSRSGAAAFPHRALLLLTLIVVALPALQLVPLPPGLWQALPGRETERAALALIGQADSWRPFTLSPPRTFAALLSLGPPLLAMFLVARLDWDGRCKLIATIALLALAGALLGVLQAVSASDSFHFYDDRHYGWATGFQANRNTTADILLIGLLASAATVATLPTPVARRTRLWLWAIASLLLACVVILTGSRTGIALLLLAFPLQLAIVWRWLGVRNVRQIVAAAGALLVAGLGAGYALQGNGVIARVTERFRLVGDFRLELWADTRFAIAQHWPFGVGMGGFTPALVAIERLEVVDRSWPNRAHDDYLELALEAGLPGLVLLGIAVLVILLMALAVWRNRPSERVQIIFAIGILTVVALHSAVDYPLRSMALATLAGTAAGLLAPSPRRSKQEDMEPQHD